MMEILVFHDLFYYLKILDRNTGHGAHGFPSEFGIIFHCRAGQDVATVSDRRHREPKGCELPLRELSDYWSGV